MMVKPAEAGGAELPAPPDEPAPDADDDADAVDALTGVGHDLPSGGGEAAAPGGEVDADEAAARGGGGADDEAFESSSPNLSMRYKATSACCALRPSAFFWT